MAGFGHPLRASHIRQAGCELPVQARDDIPEGYDHGYEKHDPTGVVTLEDYSPYIVYGGEDWIVDHEGEISRRFVGDS